MGENEFVKAINKYFDDNNITGYAYRRKQSRFQSQEVDVQVDSPEVGYWAIEHKSYKQSGSGKLYFKGNFSYIDDVHQMILLDEFSEKTGRIGLLVVEVRRGPGKRRKQYAVPLETVLRHVKAWQDGDSFCGYDLEWLEENAYEVGFEITNEFFEKFGQ